ASHRKAVGPRRRLRELQGEPVRDEILNLRILTAGRSSPGGDQRIYNEETTMKKSLIWIVVLGALGAGGWTVWPRNGKDEKKVETKKAKAERGDIVVFVTATGEIKPIREVELKSKASGLVVRFKKLPGDPVDENEL